MSRGGQEYIPSWCPQVEETLQSKWPLVSSQTFQPCKLSNFPSLSLHILILFWTQRASCAYCHDRIWGLGRQGFKCIQCKLLIHKKCHKLIKISCNTEQVAALNAPSQQTLLSATLNSSGGSVSSSVGLNVPAPTPNEPPTTLRQNGDGTEAPAAPPKVQPIFDTHSESVPVDGKQGN